ncbi:MAG: protein phosphatase 2C domain-containing protein [Spirosomataceae bacterium]
MPLTIYQPNGFSFIGNRAVNQDAVSPDLAEATEQDRLFLVCDGMGGGPSGEIASELVVQGITQFFNSYEFPFGKNMLGNGNEVADSLETQFINDAVLEAQTQLDTYLAANPTAKGMGSTLALLYLVHQQHVSSALVAHIGDSRVYQIRQGKIIWQSEDHKWVNELVKKGVLTPEEAETHPKRNVISRVVQAASERQEVADVHELFDIQPEDYFFLCSDGVLEALTDARLEEILASMATEDEKLTQLKTVCDGHTADNASAYLVKIKTAETVVTENEDVMGIAVDEADSLLSDEPPLVAQPSSPVQTKNFVIVILFLLLGSIGGWLLFEKYFKKPSRHPELKAVGTTSSTVSVPKTKPYER